MNDLNTIERAMSAIEQIVGNPLVVTGARWLRARTPQEAQAKQAMVRADRLAEYWNDSRAALGHHQTVVS